MLFLFLIISLFIVFLDLQDPVSYTHLDVYKRQVYGVDNIKEVVNFFNGDYDLEKTIVDTRTEFYNAQQLFDFDFSDVKGQENVKRALEVAAAGGHNLMR